MRIEEPKDESVLREFVAKAGDSLSHFRYFKKRPLSAFNTHLVTLVGVEDDVPVCYGHLNLDKDTGDAWLGVCVIEGKTGRGLGSEMMRALLQAAKSKGVKTVRLIVDSDNEAAKNMYERMGFKPYATEGQGLLYSLSTAGSATRIPGRIDHG